MYIDISPRGKCTNGYTLEIILEKVDNIIRKSKNRKDVIGVHYRMCTPNSSICKSSFSIKCFYLYLLRKLLRKFGDDNLTEEWLVLVNISFQNKLILSINRNYLLKLFLCLIWFRVEILLKSHIINFIYWTRINNTIKLWRALREIIEFFLQNLTSVQNIC